jgi:hypothetical protein
VTLGAGQRGVCPSQGEPDRAVVEVGGLPGRGVVAASASLGNAQRDVIGVGGLLVVGQVAADARSRRTFVIAAGVAGRAIQSCVHSGQSKPRDLEVIELSSCPCVHAMALLTTSRKGSSEVIGQSGLLIGLGVTGVTLCRQSLELAGGRSFVAGIALQYSVRSNQRKAILVVLNGLYRDVPAFYGVTLLALGTHLSAMDVGMAVGALSAHIGKHRLDVALGAGHLLV